jgi:hypothetical protein
LPGSLDRTEHLHVIDAPLLHLTAGLAGRR